MAPGNTEFREKLKCRLQRAFEESSLNATDSPSSAEGLFSLSLLESTEQREINELRADLKAGLERLILSRYSHPNVFLEVTSIDDESNPCYTICQKLGVDLLFYTYPNKPAFFNLPAWEKHGSRWILNEEAQVAGIIFPSPGEGRDEARKRAADIGHRLRFSINRSLGSANGDLDYNPTIAVATPDLLQRWLMEELPPQRTQPEVEITTDVLSQILAEQLDTLLGSENYLIQVNAVETHEFDVSVCDLDGNTIELDFMGLKSKSTAKRSATYTTVEKVVGIKSFSNAITDAGRNEAVRRSMKGMRTRLATQTHEEKARVLSVTAELAQRWDDLLNTGASFCELTDTQPILGRYTQEPEEDVVGENEQLIEAPVTQSRIKGARYATYEQGPSSIGAKPSFIFIDRSDGTTQVITLDAGAIYEGFSWSGPFKPSMKEGIAPYEDVLPQVPLWFRLTLLLKKAEAQGVSFLDIYDIDPAALGPSHFQLLDVFERLPVHVFKELCQKLAEVSKTGITDEEIDTLIGQLEQIKADSVFRQRFEHIAFLISHFHDDHVGFAATVSGEIPQAMSIEALPWIKFFASRSAWQYEVTERIDRETLLKEGTERHYRPPVMALMPYETKFIGNGDVSITALPCDHSIYGTTMFLITLYDDLQLPMYTILYTGDYRFGDQGLTEQTREVLTKIKPDAIITDTTNVGADESIKAKEKTNPEEMIENFARVMYQAQGPVVIQLDPKDLETAHVIQLAIARVNQMGKSRWMINNVRQAGSANLFLQSDRAAGFYMADVEAQMRTAELLVDPSDQDVLAEPVNLLDYHPRFRMNANVAVLDDGKKQYSPMERAVMDEYADQVISYAELLSHQERNDAVLVIPPYKSIEQEFKKVADKFKRATIVRSHFFPYDKGAKDDVRDDLAFCRKHGWRYESDLIITPQKISTAAKPRFRMGGHAQASEFLDFMGDLLTANPQMVIFPVHGENRGGAGDAIEAMALRRLGVKPNVIKRMQKNGYFYDLLDPIQE